MGDEAIHRTNDDATACKRSAVSHGYWQDPYIGFMGGKAQTRAFGVISERKAPEIHLGYFTRVRGLRMLLDRVLEQVKRLQIINLGAGFDTLYWRLKDDLEKEGHLDKLVNFVEVDFSPVTAQKCLWIKKSKPLLSRVAGEDGEVKLSGTELHGIDYHIVAADFTKTDVLEKKLKECNVDYGCPTVFLAECVLVYIPPEVVAKFFSWCTTKFTSPLVFLDHEQINLEDRFGKVMLENLSIRGCGLPGAPACKDKQSQVNRFIRNGWSGADCWTMNEVYESLPRQEVEKVEQLELFDEKELMKQLFDHYCLTAAWKNAPPHNFDDLEFWQ